jgi:hypothetical protein
VGEEGEVEGLQRGEESGGREAGGEGQRVDGVEEGVVRRAAGREREGVGGGGGGGGHGDSSAAAAAAFGAALLTEVLFFRKAQRVGGARRR